MDNKNETTDLLGLVKNIYDTVEHPGNWRFVLEKLAAYVNNGIAALTIRDNHEGHIIVDRYQGIKTWGLTKEFIDSYIENAVYEEVWTPIEIEFDVGQICVFSQHLPIEDLKKTTYYQTWLEPQGFTDAIALQLYKNEEIRIVLNVVYDDQTDRLKKLVEDLKTLTPFLCQAVMFWLKDQDELISLGFETHSKHYRKLFNLSKGEWRFLRAAIGGGTPQELAEMLDISIDTVYKYRQRIKRKMNVKDMRQAALLIDAYTSSF